MMTDFSDFSDFSDFPDFPTDADDCHVRYLAFPNRSVKGLTTPNDDGTFDIYINTLYPPDVQRATLAHELRHVRMGHFYSDAPIAVKEAEADTRPAPRITASAPTFPIFSSPEEFASWLLGQ